ncbi:MAG: DUF4259 domain-containing protein [Micropepsaceae bacterium]
MGAWGAGIFENDGASDFVWEVDAAPAIPTLMKPIDAVIAVVKSGDYLEMGLCEEANAAAEMLAALHSGDRTALSESALEIIPKIKGKPSQSEIDRARAVVERIAKDSEMAEAFTDSDVADTWLAVMQGLRARLG